MRSYNDNENIGNDIPDNRIINNNGSDKPKPTAQATTRTTT